MPNIEVIRGAGVIGRPSTLLSMVRRQRDRPLTGAVLMRGVNDRTQRLLPTIGRPHLFGGKALTFDKHAEIRMLRQFRRSAQVFMGRELSLWETMVLARRHGLPGRLLEWTLSPLTALYFACELR